MRVNLFAKTNICAESLENDRSLKTVRFQSLNFSSKPKGYLLQTTKLWEKLIVLNRRKEKSDEAKRRSRLFKLEKGKVCLNDIILFQLIIVLLTILFYSLCKMEFKLLSISSV